jgi:hypothetical protein
VSRWLNKLQARLRTLLKPAAVYVGGANVADATAQFEAWAAEHAGSVCEIGLAGAWVHVCVVPAEVVDASAGDDEALIDYARLQFEHYFGISGSAWAMAASRDARAALVCALSTELLDALRAAAAAHHVRVQRVAPWWVRGVQAVLQDALNDVNAPRAVAAIEPDRTTLVVAQEGRIARVISEASLSPHDWRTRLSGAPAAASLWAFKLGAGDEQVQALRGQVAPELVFQQIEASV